MPNRVIIQQIFSKNPPQKVDGRLLKTPESYNTVTLNATIPKKKAITTS